MRKARDEILFVPGVDVADVLAGEEAALMGIVSAAYGAHGRGESVLPHSCFLRLPEGNDRIVALPAYLGGVRRLAGLKWISSFPANVERGVERASGLVVLNCLDTGRPRAVIDGGIVSAKRTAASAAVAARVLHPGTAPTTVGFVGCGSINFETLCFLRGVWPGLATVALADVSVVRVEAFAARVRRAFAGLQVVTLEDWRAVIENADLVVFATTAMAPYVESLNGERVRTVVHLSLRDLDPAVVLRSDNVVDDVDHVCRADTSLDLAARASGGRAFIRCTLADVLAGFAAPKRNDSVTIFSPFGLGILDIAVANFVCERAEARGRGTRIPWAARAT